MISIVNYLDLYASGEPPDVNDSITLVTDFWLKTVVFTFSTFKRGLSTYIENPEENNAADDYFINIGS